MSMATEVSGGELEVAAVDEAGTAPGDRRFRPDVEGLRAVAVILVVLYHANLPGLSGGYVGVDVFFVISGFVITGLLLREHATTGSTSLASFYGRRVRRILPAATLVVVATVIATYAVLGAVSGDPAAVAARWCAVFLANFHFASTDTEYLTSSLPPSPLQNFWSLAVEEQFYLVYPAIFLVAASLRSATSLRARLAITLVTIIALSLLASVIQTSSAPASAFFSPLTRAWELALGALVAVVTPALLRLPRATAAALTWAGMAAIGFAAITYSSATSYPGAAVMVPVVGTALVIAGGTPVPRLGVEPLLALAPIQWLGRLSYSLYLWHWPILIIATEAAGLSVLPFHRTIAWLLLSVVLAYATQRLVENPVRHARILARHRRLPLALGAVLVAVSLAVSSLELAMHSSPAFDGRGGATAAVVPLQPDEVRALVNAAPQITALPHDLRPNMSEAAFDFGGPPARCWPDFPDASIPACAYGDTQGKYTMVLYGDSHAAMWFSTIDRIALRYHWRLLVLTKSSCPVVDLPVQNPPNDLGPGGVFTACTTWHSFVAQRIRQAHASLIIISQFPRASPQKGPYSAGKWGAATASAIRQLPVPADRIIVLGNIPVESHGGPSCLSLHPTDVQACSGPRMDAGDADAERLAAAATGARYINPAPWFCSHICTDVIGRYQPYWDEFHATGTYANALGLVLANAIDLGSYASRTALQSA